jgi:hypothetical protein
MNDFTEWAKLIMEEIRRFDQNHRDILRSLDKIKDEQVEQGKVLVQNTASLEEHIRRTNILEEEVQRIEEKMPVPIPWKKVAAIVSIIGGIVGLALQFFPL